MQPVSRVSRVLQPVLARKSGDFHIGRNEVSATSRGIARMEKHREEVLRLVDLARHEGKRISQDTWHYIYRTAPHYTNEPNAAVMELFLEIIANPVRLGELLRRLLELGVLERIVPEFAHARCARRGRRHCRDTRVASADPPSHDRVGDEQARSSPPHVC